MAIVVSDHRDPDVDFYVPPGTDATTALQNAIQLAKVYGVAHIIIRGRLYVYASQNVPLLLEQSLHYIFEGDGLGEIVYVNPLNISNPNTMIAAGSLATTAIQGASNNNAVVLTQILSYSMWGWIIAFKNLRLVNITSQRWIMITGFPYHMHSTMFYFDTVQFFANIWLNQTADVVIYNCYVNNSELLFDTQSRELIVFGSRFENQAVLAISPRGWTVIGCSFIGANTTLNPGNDGNDGSVIGCIFDGGKITTQGAQNLRIVGCQFQNVTFSGNETTPYIHLYSSNNYAIVASTFVNYNVFLSDLWLSNSVIIGFNTFQDSNLIIQVRDGQQIASVVIIGNTFSSDPYHNAFIFITSSPAPGSNTIQFTGLIRMLYIAFNTFINEGFTKGAAYGVQLTPTQRIHAQAYINIATPIAYAYIVFNYFQQNYGLYDNSTGKPIGVISIQQFTSSITIQNLLFYFNVNENNPLYIPSSQTYTSQFNIGM